MSLLRDIVPPTRMMISILFLLLQSSGCLSEGPPVDLEARTNWYCYSKTGRWFWTGQSLEEGCYRYVCKQDQGILRVWTPEILSHCCARNGKAYQDGETILEESHHCQEVH